MRSSDELKSIKERYLHAYRSQREVLENIGAERPCTDFYHKMAIQRVTTMNRIYNPLEMIAMDLAWIIQRIKHPIKMHRLIKVIKALN